MRRVAVPLLLALCAACGRDIVSGVRFECPVPGEPCGPGCTCRVAPPESGYSGWCECPGVAGPDAARDLPGLDPAGDELAADPPGLDPPAGDPLSDPEPADPDPVSDDAAVEPIEEGQPAEVAEATGESAFETADDADEPAEAGQPDPVDAPPDGPGDGQEAPDRPGDDGADPASDVPDAAPEVAHDVPAESEEGGCVPACDGRACGPDGCGGLCGLCFDDSCATRSCDGVTGLCVATAREDGIPCDADGNGCTAGDACAAGACVPGRAPDCSGLADACNSAACAPTARAAYDCVKVPLPDGTGCDADADGCTVGDACAAGACVPGRASDCSWLDDACNSGACAPTSRWTHECIRVPLPDGTGCDADGDGCTVGDACDAGACRPGAVANCTAVDDACGVGACTSTGATTHECVKSDRGDGTPCDADGDGCTIGDACFGGACRPGTVGDCSPMDDVCNEGICVSFGPVEHACATRALPGSACDDGRVCTLDDSCDEDGMCTGGTPVICVSPSPCRTSACSEAAGGCVVADVPDGTPCDADGDGCTSGDACAAGACVAGAAVECEPDPDTCHRASCVSDGADTHHCATTPKAAGTPCEDGAFCTVGDTCDEAGACEPGAPRTCPPTGCVTSPTCNEALDVCDGTAKPDGTACDADGDGCTQGDSCSGGACRPGAPRDCANPLDLCNDWVCVSRGATASACEPKPLAMNTPCDDGHFCTTDDACDGAGGCKNTKPRDCSDAATDVCQDGTCDETADKCVSSAKPDNTACDDADSCTVGDRCLAGACKPTGNVCPDSKASQVQVAGAAVPRPEIADLPGLPGFRVAWAASNGTVHTRAFDGQMSRMNWEDEFASSAASYQIAGLALLRADSRHELAIWRGDFTATGNQDCVFCRNSAAHCHGLVTPTDCTGACVQPCCGGYECINAGCGDTAWRYSKNWYTETFPLELDLQDQWLASVSRTPLQLGSATRCTIGSAPPPAGNASVARAGDGRHFLVFTWEGTTRFRILKADGTTESEPANPNPTTMNRYHVISLADGRWVVAWDDGVNVKAQLFLSGGQAEGATVAVGAGTAPRLAGSPTSRWLVAWNTAGGDVSVRGFKAANAGTAFGPSTVNTTTAGVQQNPASAFFADETFLVAFEDHDGRDGSGAGILGQWFTALGAKSGAERVLNVTVNGDQTAPAVLVLGTGDAIVAWNSRGAAVNVYVRRFSSTGTPRPPEPERRANTTTAGDQSNPAVAALSSSGYAVAWDGPGTGGNSDIFLRRYRADGPPVSAEEVVNATLSADQRRPAVAADSTGAFVVAWDSLHQAANAEDVWAQRYTSAGARDGGEFRVNETTAWEQQKAAVAVFPAGRIVVAWESFSTANSFDVKYRCFDKTGGAESSEQVANADMKGSQSAPSVAALAGSPERFVIVWQTSGDNSNTYGVAGRVFLASTCLPTATSFTIAGTAAAPLTQPKVAAGPDGRSLVAWRVEKWPGMAGDLFMQRFDATVAKVGTDVLMNAQTPGDQSAPAVSFLDSQWVTTAWQAAGGDEAGTAVRLRRFNIDTLAQGMEVTMNLYYSGDQGLPVIATLPTGNVVSWRSVGHDGDQGAIITRIYSQ